MLLRLRRKVSTLSTPLPTTFTSFVTINPPGPSAINRLSRIVVAEGGLVTTQTETAGVTHSRPGKRHFYPLSPPVEMLITVLGLLV